MLKRNPSLKRILLFLLPLLPPSSPLLFLPPHLTLWENSRNPPSNAKKEQKSISNPIKLFLTDPELIYDNKKILKFLLRRIPFFFIFQKKKKSWKISLKIVEMFLENVLKILGKILKSS